MLIRIEDINNELGRPCQRAGGVAGAALGAGRGGCLACAAADGGGPSTQLIEPIELAPYCTKPDGIGVECCAVIGM